MNKHNSHDFYFYKKRWKCRPISGSLTIPHYFPWNSITPNCYQQWHTNHSTNYVIEEIFPHGKLIQFVLISTVSIIILEITTLEIFVFPCTLSCSLILTQIHFHISPLTLLSSILYSSLFSIHSWSFTRFHRYARIFSCVFRIIFPLLGDGHA